MSNNGYVVPHQMEPETSATANQYVKPSIRNSARVHLNGNVARRIVKGGEFFWWDIELHGFGLRCFHYPVQGGTQSSPSAVLRPEKR